jgi:hypothetical protein
VFVNIMKRHPINIFKISTILFDSKAKIEWECDNFQDQVAHGCKAVVFLWVI